MLEINKLSIWLSAHLQLYQETSLSERNRNSTSTLLVLFSRSWQSCIFGTDVTDEDLNAPGYQAINRLFFVPDNHYLILITFFRVCLIPMFDENPLKHSAVAKLHNEFSTVRVQIISEMPAFRIAEEKHQELATSRTSRAFCSYGSTRVYTRTPSEWLSSSRGLFLPLPLSSFHGKFIRRSFRFSSRSCFPPRPRRLFFAAVLLAVCALSQSPADVFPAHFGSPNRSHLHSPEPERIHAIHISLILRTASSGAAYVGCQWKRRCRGVDFDVSSGANNALVKWKKYETFFSFFFFRSHRLRGAALRRAEEKLHR